jgi:NADH dehydrogenase
MKVVVTGASGFVGSHIISGLLSAGHTVRGLSRTSPGGDRRKPDVEYVDGVNVAEASTLTPAMFRDAGAVIHLVGIIQEGRGGQTFQRIHVEGTRNVVETARAAGFTGRIVYMSAIGTSEDAPAEYSRTKARAEKIVQESGLPYTIFRPSLILGRDGEFVQQMEELIRYGGLPVHVPFPVIPVPGSGNNRFQPIDIDDLMQCVVQCVSDPATEGQVYEVGGAEQVSFNEIIQGISRALGVRKPAVHAPIPVLRVVATVMEAVLPKPPVTRDQLANLGRDNITNSRAVESVFGVKPLGFHAIIEKIYGSADGAANRAGATGVSQQPG